MLDWSVACFVCEPCILVCSLVVVTFLAIDLNEECAEEGEVFEYQEEGDQGQANQGKPSFDAYLNPIVILCIASYYSLIYALIPHIAIGL
jgi:hypothetical protein